MLNLWANLPKGHAGEVFDDLLAVPGLRIERIVSHGQASPPGFWYDQPWDEWVIVLQGEAELRLEHQPEPLLLGVGDHCWLPAGCRHRVERTAHDPATVWLAVHRGADGMAAQGAASQPIPPRASPVE